MLSLTTVDTGLLSNPFERKEFAFEERSLRKSKMMIIAM